MSLIAVWIAVRVAGHATRKGTFAAGVSVGLIAGFGRNHGLYSAVAVLIVITVVSWHMSGRARLSNLGSYILGIAVGYLPIIAHCFFVPHYFGALWDAVSTELSSGTTNIPLPIPWPWLVSLQGRSWPDAVQTFGMSNLFVAVPLTYAIAVVVLIRHFDQNDPAHQLSLGAVAIGIFYLHHAFSRADYVHLLEGIQAFIPEVAALLAIAGRRVPWIRPHAILTAGVLPPFLVWNAIHQPRFELLVSPPGAYSLIDANGSTLSVPQPIASAVTALREIKASDLKAGETMLIAPHWPMAYALLRLRSPIWEIYHLFARPEAFQRAEIADLEHARVAFAIFSDPAIDGRNDRRMSTQEPIFYKYLLDNYVPIESPALPAPYRLYRRATPFPPVSKP
jgi:hypothetical protein